MSKLSVPKNIVESQSSQKTVKTKDSLFSKKSRNSGSIISVHGSRFGRSVNRLPKPNDPGLTQTLSVENSRIIRTVFNPTLTSDSILPDLSGTTATDSIRELGKSLNILDYEFNYSSFWLLDVLSKHLKDMQLKNFSSSHQETFLSWFRFVLRCISITGSSREEIFTLLQEMFKLAVEIIQQGTLIPLPEDIDIGGSGDMISPQLSADMKIAESLTSSIESTASRKGRKRTLSQNTLRKSSRNSEKSKKSVSRKSSTVVVIDEPDNEKEDVKKLNMQVFRTIIDILYQIFAERFAFMVTSLAYSSPNISTLVYQRVEFNDPKPLKIEPDPPPPTLAAADSRKSGTKARKKSKDKGKKKKKSTSIEDDQGKTVKSDSGNKKGNKSKKGSKPSTDMGTEIGDEKKSKKEKKGKGEKDSSPSKKGKGKEKPKKSKSDGDVGGEIMEDQNKAAKTKGGNRKKSKESLRKKSKTSDASVGKENKSPKSKKGKEKGKTKKEVKDVTDEGDDGKESKSKGKSGAKSAKPGKKKKKSTLRSIEDKNNQLDDRQLALQKFRKQFDRPVRLGMEEETGIKNKFIFPLSDAVDKNYVETLICSLLPPEVQKEAEPKLTGENIKKDTRKSRSLSRSSVHSKKKKPKSKKK